MAESPSLRMWAVSRLVIPSSGSWKLCNICFSSRNTGLKCLQNAEEGGDSEILK